jgi:L-ribulose-5-phosphate 4-epimerase
MGTGYLDQIKQEAFEINMGIVRERLVVLTWGNASTIDRSSGIFAIKPSGISYSLLKWQDMVLVDLDGKVIDSKLKPSSDTLTHIELYKGFNAIGGIVHTHSQWATIWAQANKSIPALGTTHSDHFNGDVPCIPVLKKEQVLSDYEKESGIQIVDYFNEKKIEPIQMPACLLSGHASFTWGETSNNAFENAIALEVCAKMAYFTLSINSIVKFPEYILDKHFSRKHGVKSYYGQKNNFVN